MSKYLDFPIPKLSLLATVGGFYRVEIHGLDINANDGTYAVMDIGRGDTKEAAMEQARAWFASIQDRCPTPRITVAAPHNEQSRR